MGNTGRRLEDQSVHNDQVHSTVNLYPGHTSRCPAIALRLFLLAAQIADECGFEDLTYDLYVQAFTVYEESISESRAQLQAVALIVGTLQGAKVFSSDNFDTLITKAALHGAKLLKKPHQSSAVSLASHMWWQETSPADGEAEKVTPPDGTEEKEEMSAPTTSKR
jgi:vacuolar protein sorting-associated protein 35